MSHTPIPKLADWEDEKVKRVYEILCDQLEHKPDEEHWEGYCARWIVAELVQPLQADLDTEREQNFALRQDFEEIVRQRDSLKAQVAQLTEQLNFHEHNRDEREQICVELGIPPSDCCAPKYCALAAYKAVKELQARVKVLRAALEAFPSLPASCPHGEEPDYCPCCDTDWSIALAAWTELMRKALEDTK